MATQRWGLPKDAPKDFSLTPAQKQRKGDAKLAKNTLRKREREDRQSKRQAERFAEDILKRSPMPEFFGPRKVSPLKGKSRGK